MASLKDKTVSGIIWSLLQNVGGKGLSFVVMIVLARLLTPAIFGLIGMLMIFIQISQTLVIAGFNQALIQKKDTDEEDFSSVFWINLVVSLLIYGLLFVGAPYISEFYDQPELTKLTRVLSLIFVINAFSYVQQTKLQKEMRFKTLTIIHIPSTVIGGVVGIGMALLDFGVWSLVGVQLVTRFLYTVQIWFYSKWQPLWTFNKQKARQLFSFGSKLLVSGIIDTIFRNIYLVIIGKFFPVSAVGYYQNANQLVQTPSTTFSSALNKVTFSAFSTIQDEDEKLKEGFKKVIQQVLFWLCPIFIIAGVLAVPLFRFVFTEKWLPAVPYFRLLCVVGIMLPLHLYNLSIINVKGRSDLFLKLEIIKKTVVVIGLIVTVPIGIYALLIFQAVSSVLMYFVNAHFSGKFINYPIQEQLKDITPILLLSIFVGGGAYLLDTFITGNLSDILRLLICGIVGATLYALIAIKMKFQPYIEFKSIARSLLASKRAMVNK